MYIDSVVVIYPMSDMAKECIETGIRRISRGVSTRGTGPTAFVYWAACLG
jgi:hypothetical protein